MMGWSIFRRWRKDTAATAGVEFAFVVPVLILLLAGVVEVGRAFQVYRSVNLLATQYATTWADCSDSPKGTCQTELATFTATASVTNIAPLLDQTKLTLRMFQVTMNGSTPTIVYTSQSGATLSSYETSSAQALLTSTQSGVIVTCSYQHSLKFFQVLMTPTLSKYLTAAFTTVQLKY